MMNNQETYAVQLEQVSKRFGAVTAVEQVSLAIEEGEFFALLGPSGCGKTTTLRMIGGFELPTEGEVYLQGRAVGQLPPFKRPVNTVFQSYALFPHLTVYENIAFGLKMQKVPPHEIQRRVQEALEMVRLPDMGPRQPSQLSGGQKQRVALARALVNRPAVLLLDEPLGALDLKLRKAMQIELKELQRELGITFVFVTHDQEEALVMSDRIGVMDGGRLLQVGPPQAIYDQPTSRFVADFIGETNLLPCQLLERGAENIAAVQIAPTLTAQAVCDAPLTAGQEATLAIRPEKIRLHPADTADRLTGRIVETIFLGTDTRLRVALTPDITLEVRSQNSDTTAPAFQPGQTVALSWSPESARLLGE